MKDLQTTVEELSPGVYDVSVCYGHNKDKDIGQLLNEREAKELAKFIKHSPNMMEALNKVKDEFSQYAEAHGTSKCGAYLDVLDVIEELQA